MTPISPRKGRKFLSPDDPDAFVIPDLVTALQEIDAQELPDGEKEKKKQQIQQAFDERSEKIHNISQLLRAYWLFEKDVEYVVQDNKVMIVDEYTGRLMPGRRWSDGLHQAVEAKEGVAIERETQTLATITIQNYFRLYKKLAGMTGTAETEATEFEKSTSSVSSSFPPTGRAFARMKTTWSTRRDARSTTRSSRISWNATRRPARRSSARSASRPAKCCPACWAARRSPTTSSMRNTTSARRRSSPAPVRRAR